MPAFVQATTTAPISSTLTHDSDLSVKMEDRKRPASDSKDAASPPLKKQAKSASTSNFNGDGSSSSAKPHPDADMPWRDDLERVQKDAILRQMQEYKRERNTLESRLKDLEKSTKYHDAHIRVIDAWLSQLIAETRLLLSAQGEDEEAPQEPPSIPSSLLSADEEGFSDHLKSHATEIKELVSRILSRVPKAPPEITELKTQLSNLLAEQKATKLELEKSVAERQQLEERLDAASYRYMVAEKKIDRARSLTVAKLEKQDILGPQRKPAQATAASGNVSITTSNGNTASTERVRDLEELHQRSKAVSEKQKEQLEKLEADNAKLLSQVTELNVRFTKLSDEDYSQTDLFKQLKSQHEDVIKRINHLEALNIQLREEAQSLQAERTAYRIQIENESQAAVKEKESQLTKAEFDLARIRNTRDELLADQAVKKSVLDQERTATAHSKELLEARDQRIQSLESEVERLRLQIDGLKEDGGGTEGGGGADVENMGIEDLRTKYKTLDKQYAMLNQELSSMQQAFRKTSKLAAQKISDLRMHEEKVQRLAAEKSKADQKYFAAMKSKEAREHELMTLRIQNSKSGDIVAQLKEAETATRSLLSNVEKQLAETKDTLTSALSQNNAGQQQLTEANIVINSLRNQVSDLKKVATTRDSSLASAQTAARRLETEVEDLKASLSETKKSLESWRTKGLGKGHQSSEYEMLRTLALCSVCRRNFKNTVIKTCGHVFCRDCVEERLTSRSRKCPNCNRSFGNNDYMHITL